MDFLVEIVLEVLGEFMIEGGASAASDRRRPMWQRVLVLALIVLFFTAVFALMAAAGIVVAADGRPAAGIVMLALDLALIVFSFYSLRKILRTFSHK